MSGMQMMTAATIGGALVFGMALALFGSLKLALARRLQPDDVHIRRMLAALNVALMLLVLMCGLFVDLYGARWVLLGGSLTLTGGLVCLIARPTYPHAVGAVLLAALGAAALGTASTVLMPRAFFAPAETSASLNLGYVFIALGALLTPVLTDILLQRGNLRRALGLFALVAFVPAVLALFPHAEHWRIADRPSDSTALLAEPAIWLAALVCLIYTPLEASISLWTFNLLSERGQDERRAVGLLSGFWAAFVTARLLVALGQHGGLMTEAWNHWLIVVPPLLAAVLIGNLAGSSQRGRLGVGLVLLGLLLGPVFPTLLGVIFRHVAPAEQGLAYGLVFTAGSLGSLLLAPLAGFHTQQPLQTMLRAPIFLALLLTAMALVLGLMTP